MGIKLSLKHRIYIVNAVLVCTTMIGAALMIWYTYKTEAIFNEIIDKNIVVYQSAEALGTSLVKQKGFVSYYLLDKDPSWIDQLNSHKAKFHAHLKMVESLVTEPWEIQAVSQIHSKYNNYIEIRDKVIDLYRAEAYKKGFVLHKEIREDFSKILELCDQFKSFHKNRIAQAIENSKTESNQLRYIALMGIITVIMLSLMINYIFARHILEPIRILAKQTDRLGDKTVTANELTALKNNVHGLIETAQQTHEELKQSRETLMQSEKMALLGKLAAGTAHSIRNPLTSVNMRLFSLNRSCAFTPGQQDDFNVISGEIKQINKILENFLEFSRPPRLNVRRLSPSSAVDNALHLLAQRLKSYGVRTELIRHHPLSPASIDLEQLKEVLVNIMINACEAITRGGVITIHEEEKYLEPETKVAVIKISDNGPGIPGEIMDKIFNPFYTTKDEGTGLGLSIAFNIINEHKGWLDVHSESGQGAAFTITLPI